MTHENEKLKLELAKIIHAQWAADPNSPPQPEDWKTTEAVIAFWQSLSNVERASLAYGGKTVVAGGVLQKGRQRFASLAMAASKN